MKVHFKDDYFFDQKKKRSFWSRRERHKQHLLFVPDELKKESAATISPALSLVVSLPEEEVGFFVIPNNRGDMDPWFSFCARLIKLSIARLVFAGNLQLIYYTDKVYILGGLIKKEEKGFSLSFIHDELEVPTWFDRVVLKSVKITRNVKLSEQITQMINRIVGWHDLDRPARSIVFKILSAGGKTSRLFQFTKGSTRWTRSKHLIITKGNKKRLKNELNQFKVIYLNTLKASRLLTIFFQHIQNETANAVCNKMDNSTID